MHTIYNCAQQGAGNSIQHVLQPHRTHELSSKSTTTYLCVSTSETSYTQQTKCQTFRYITPILTGKGTSVHNTTVPPLPSQKWFVSEGILGLEHNIIEEKNTPTVIPPSCDL